MRRGRNRRSHVPLRHHKFRGRRLSSDRPRRFPAANHARITRTSCRAHLLCRPRHRRSRLRQQNDAASRHLGVANHSLSGSARCHTRRRISPRRLCRRSREAKRQSLRTALCVDRRALAQAPHRNGSLPARFACACSVVILISPLHLCTVSASRLISSPLSSSASIHPSQHSRIPLRRSFTFNIYGCGLIELQSIPTPAPLSIYPIHGPTPVDPYCPFSSEHTYPLECSVLLPAVYNYYLSTNICLVDYIC